MAEAVGKPQKISQRVNARGKKSDINAEPSRQVQNKRMSAWGGALAMLMAMLLLLVAAGVAVFLNVADSRMILVGLLQSVDPIVGQEFDAFAAERGALVTERSELDVEKAALQAERSRLSTVDAQLKQRERALREIEVQMATDAEEQAQAAADREKMLSVITKLDARNAARILQGLSDPKEIADILLLLKEKFAASILIAMDQTVAMRVVKEALNRSESPAFLEGLPYELLPDETPAPTPTPTPAPSSAPTPAASMLNTGTTKTGSPLPAAAGNSE